jgi:hypothetical protein
VFASIPITMISYDEISVSVGVGVYFNFGFIFIFIPNKLLPSAQYGICCACSIKFRHYLLPAGFLLGFSQSKNLKADPADGAV